MAPKRTHKKSRKGCKTCRQRHVKCDEIRPICTNCTKREIECVWGPSVSLSLDRYGSSNQEPQRTAGTSSESPTTPMDFNSAPFVTLTTTVPSPSTPVSLDMESLHLLHHYSHSSLWDDFPSQAASGGHQLAILAPRLAFTHEYLMHILLALSALHIDLKCPSPIFPTTNYRSVADKHYHHAMTGIIYGELDPPNADRDAALFLANSLMSLFYLARPRQKSDSWTPKVLDWIPHVRYASRVLKDPKLYSGPLASLFGTGTRIIKEITSGAGLGAYPSAHMNSFPTALLDIHLPTSSAPDRAEVEDVETSEVYRHAVSVLRIAHAVDTHTKFHGTSVFTWPISISDAFVLFLREQRPRALVILVQYCTILQRNTGLWWQADLDDNIRKIAAVLDERWLSWLRTAVGIGHFSDEEPAYDSPLSNGADNQAQSVISVYAF